MVKFLVKVLPGNHHFWRLGAMMAVCSLVYYLDAISGALGWQTGQSVLSKLHDFYGLVFFGPVVYAAYVFGLRGALITALLTMVVLYPYAVYVTPYEDAVYRSSAFGIILSAVGAAVAMIRKSDEHRRRSMAEIRCLYDVGRQASECSSLDEFLLAVVKTIPEAFPHPDKVGVRVRARDQVYESGEIGSASKTAREELWAGAEPLGSLEVHFRAKQNVSVTNPTLVKTLAERISGAARRLALEDSLKVYSEQLEDMVEERTEDLKSAHEQLRLLSNAVKSSIDAITLLDLEGRVTFANEAAQRMWGYGLAELQGLALNDLFVPEEANRVENEVIPNTRTKAWTGELLAEHQNGTKVPVLLTTSPVYDEDGNTVAVVALHRDMTETRNMHEQLIRSERLAAVGELASGVGHELRNPLNVIRNCVYLLNMTIGDGMDEDCRDTLKLLDQQVDISNKIVTDLLNFTRIRPPALAKVDLNSLVAESLSWIVIPEDIRVQANLEEATPMVMVDAEQVGRALANIMSNAVQSMNGAGHLQIGTGASNGHAWVEIQDTGCGIPNENLEKIFQPLFTTKPRGIGLGLAITRGLVEQNGGNIEIGSQVGIGTRFKLSLPAF